MSGREDALTALIASEYAKPAESCLGVAVGRLVALHDDAAWIRVDPIAPPASARTIVELCADDIDQEFVVVFESGDTRRPMILGRVLTTPTTRPSSLLVNSDGERLVLSARERIVLECGEASITLTRSGKVLIRGHYVLSRATGVNAVKGGSIELN